MSERIDVLAPPVVSVKGVTVEHNAKSWRVATNKHPTIDRFDWGWIDGAPGSICWEDGTSFDRKAAGEMVAAHNQWLEEQKPLSIRMIEARERQREAKRKFDDAKLAFDRASSSLDKCEDEMSALAALARIAPNELHDKAAELRGRGE